MAAFAHLERRLIAERTKDALAQKRAAGIRAPIAISRDVEEWVVVETSRGLDPAIYSSWAR